MAKVIYNAEFNAFLEINYEDCEILVNVLSPELAHLQKKNGLNRILLQEGELTDAKRLKLEKSIKREASVKELLDVIIEIGNHLEPHK